MSEQEKPSPLAEASPTSLDELFSRDPMNLLDQDLDIIVAELRRRRSEWDLTESKAKTKKLAPKGPAPAALSLDDLE